MKKHAVHNLNEIKALIKEAYSSGSEHEFDKTDWYTHDGKYLAKSLIRNTEFELVVEDTDALEGYRSVTVEV